MQIAKLKAGQRVYSVESHKMGNTSIKTVGVFPVDIVEVDPNGRWVIARWNGNQPRKFYRTSKWRKEKPMLVEGLLGRWRLATRDEIKAMKEANERANQPDA